MLFCGTNKWQTQRHASNQPTIHQISSNHTQTHAYREIERAKRGMHTARRCLALSIHSERHRNFVLLVTWKIWLRQCHQNNLSFFSSFFSLSLSFFWFYCLVWMLSFHLVVCLTWFPRFRNQEFRLESDCFSHTQTHTDFDAYISLFNLFLCSHSAVCQSRIGFVSIWLFDILFERKCGICCDSKMYLPMKFGLIIKFILVLCAVFFCSLGFFSVLWRLHFRFVSQLVVAILRAHS